MTFKLGKEEVWSDFYDWVSLPVGDEENEPNTPLVPVEETKAPRAKSTTATRKPGYKRQPLKPKGETVKKPKNTGPNAKTPLPPPPEPVEQSPRREPTPEQTLPMLEDKVAITNLIEDLDPEYKEFLQHKRAKQAEEAEVASLLQPDPIMTLRDVLGYSGSELQWKKEVLYYTSSTVMIGLNTNTMQKWIYSGHSSDIISMATGKELAVTAQANGMVAIWHYETPKPIYTFKTTQLRNIKAITLNLTNQYLATAGKDKEDRDTILVWDISNTHRGIKPSLFARQISGFPINQLKFTPHEEMKMVSVGYENIRFWRVKAGYIPGASVVLNEHARYTDYLNISFDQAKNIDDAKVYLTSALGMVYIVGYKSREIQGVFQIHAESANACAVSDGFVVTAGSDCLLRVWPIDFTEFFIEARHEVPVTAVSISAAGNKAVCGTANGSIGLLDLTTQEYITLIRSHSLEISSFDIFKDMVLTTSSDNSIRVWKIDGLSEICEFPIESDTPVIASFHPSEGIFAAGFTSGFVRVYDIMTIAQKFEYNTHTQAIKTLKHSPDGKWLITCAEDGICAIYDTLRKYQVAKTIKTGLTENLSADFSIDSKHFGFLCYTGVSIWEVSSLAQTFKLNLNNLRSMKFVPDGGLALTTHSTEIKLLYYTFTANELVLKDDFASHSDDHFDTYAFTNNMRYLVAGCHDILIWEGFNFSKYQAFSHFGRVRQVQFSHDCRKLFVICEGQSALYVWDFLGDLSVQEAVQESLPAIEEVKEVPTVPGLHSVPDEGRELRMRSGDLEGRVKQLEEELKTFSAQPHSPQSSPKHKEKAYSPMKLPVDTTNNLELSSVVWIGTSSLVWCREQSWFAYASGCNVSVIQQAGYAKQHILSRHHDKVGALAVPPDGRILASASRTAYIEGVASIILWDMASLTVIRTLSYHRTSIDCLAFSGCGNYLVSIENAAESTLVVWEVNTGSVLTTAVLTHKTSAIKWNWHLPGDLEFVTLADEVVTYWRLNQYRQLEFQVAAGEAKPTYTAIEFTPVYPDLQSSLMLLGTTKGYVEVWDTRSNTFISESRVFNGRITQISAGSTRVTVAGDQTHVNSWPTDTALFKGQADILLLDGSCAQLVCDGPGEEALAISSNGTVWYVNWEARSTIRLLTSHKNAITSIATFEDLIATGSNDNTMRLWTPEGEEILQHQSTNHTCTAVEVYPAESCLAAGFSDGTVRFFHTRSLKYINKCKASQSSITTMKFAGEVLLVSSDTGIISVVFFENWEPLQIRIEQFGMAGAGVCNFDVSPFYPRALLLASTSNARISVWEKKPHVRYQNRLFEDETSEFTLVDVFDVITDTESQGIDRGSQTNSYSYFSRAEKNETISISEPLQTIYFRNYLTHTITRTIEMGHFPATLTVCDRYYAVSTPDRLILLYNWFETHGEEAISHIARTNVLKFSEDETSLISAGGEEVAIWKIKVAS